MKNMEELNELDLGPAEPNYTFNHVIAIGAKAERMLSHLKKDCGKWFVDELIDIKEGQEEIRNLIVVADESAKIVDLPKEFSNDEYLRHNLYVLDIAKEPRQDDWSEVFSYIWVPAKRQFTTIKNFFEMYYHDALSMGSLICFDFNDWQHTVRGKSRMTIYKIHIDGSLRYRLKKLPISSSPDDKYLVIAGVHSFKEWNMGKWMKSLNVLFGRLPENAYLHWTILGKELSKQDAYVALMQFEQF